VTKAAQPLFIYVTHCDTKRAVNVSFLYFERHIAVNLYSPK